METFLVITHIILSFAILVVVLMQSGQGGGLGAGFSSAAAAGQEVFGGRGAASFLGKLTWVVGIAFMVTSMGLAWYGSKPQSALDLQQTADEPVDPQEHEVLHEGQAPPMEGLEELEEDGDLSFDPAAPAPGGEQGEGLEIEMDEDAEIPEELQEQLDEMGVEPGVEEAPDDIEESPAIEIPADDEE